MVISEEEIRAFFQQKIGKHENLKEFTSKKLVITALDWGSTPFYTLVKSISDDKGIDLHDKYLKLHKEIKEWIEGLEDSLSLDPPKEVTATDPKDTPPDE